MLRARKIPDSCGREKRVQVTIDLTGTLTGHITLNNYVFMKPLPHEQGATQGQSLSEFEVVWVKIDRLIDFNDMSTCLR